MFLFQSGNKDGRRRGFKLVELLVAIAVVVIVAACLVPLLKGNEKRPMVDGCLGNQKRIMAAMSQYVDDYNGCLPPGVWRKGKSNFVTWDTCIKKYVKDDAVFRCPADVTKGTRSYAFNDQRVHRNGERKGKGMRLSSMKQPSKYVAICDYHNDVNKLGESAYVLKTSFAEDNEQFHSEASGNCYAFFDGHAEYQPYGKINNENFVFDVGAGK